MEEKEQNPQAAVAEVKEQNAHTDGSIDFSGVKALADSSYKVEKWYVSLGYGIVEKLISLGLFLFGFLLDIVKTLWVIVKGIFVGIYKIGLGIGHFFRNVARMCKEGDKYVKMSTFCQGLRNMKGGQVGDGIVFLAVEILFIVYMALFGVKALINFVMISEEQQAAMGNADEFGEMPNNSSIRFLISGILTIIVIAAYLFVWYNGMKSAHDNYIIHNNFRFMQARADQIKTVEHASEYGEFYDVVDAKDKNGNPYKKLVYRKPREIRRIAREVYGFPRLSAQYISYVPFDHLQDRPLNGFQSFILKMKQGFYNGYDKVRTKIKNGKWSSLFGKFLEWKFLPPKSKYGYDVVHNEVLGGFNRFRHTYDKYNDYLSVVRDSESLLRVLDNPELLEQAIHGEDPVSVQNGIQPIAHGSKINPKSAASRVVGAFECSYKDGVTASEYYLRAVKEQAKTQVAPKQKIEAIAKSLHQRLEDFVRINSKELKEGVHETERLYLAFEEVMPIYGQGKKAFKEAMVNGKHISKFDAEALYGDIAYAQKVYGDDEAKIKEFLSKRAERHADMVERYETYPFHGQPMHFKKKVKQYADEKFAVTVLALPVLGAMITSVLPLLVSIVVAFTDYSGLKASFGNFGWTISAWVRMFSDGTGGSGSIGQTFMYILGWTIVWAIFATFTNYILGIVLALLINKKSIKLKSVYRTFFVISIAIPQFVTLLAMSKILGPNGPIHAFARSIDPSVPANYWWLNDPANQGLSAKICLILVNVWIGIPYTMLSTSGILLNIPEDLYESASIDGANPWTQFWKITMPYILFVTGPSLLTSFIGNINNFNVIFFLTGGGPAFVGVDYEVLDVNAGYTDLLITYLFKITVNSDTHMYALGSVIGILVFAICAFFSLIMYSRMGSTQNEEAFQ
ncbi:MAG: sugar ABC transporter permease [Erysipelotrichaceae bacterium]|jgi:ABC-type sugar transport system permease subunit|nr:sugar ABC transporter permease [Erysipelotrichaceae bacterium]